MRPLLGATALLACVQTPTGQAEGGAQNAARWRDDLRVFAAEIPRRHANAFHTTSRAAFNTAVRALDSLIPFIEEDKIVVGLMRIGATIGDGHTGVNIRGLLERRAPYPIALFWFDGDLRVIAGAGSAVPAVGATITSIGGVPLAEARRRVVELVPRGESPLWIEHLSALLLTMPTVLHGLGLSGPEHVVFDVQQDGASQPLGVAVRSLGTNDDRTFVLAGESGQLRYRQRRFDPMWWLPLPGTSLMYFAFNAYPDPATFDGLSARLMADIDANGSTGLIIDLRNNFGGDFTLPRRFLLPRLRNHRAAGPGRLFGVIGRATFSAAMVTAVDLREQLGALLVGEPTGARPNGYQEGTTFALPHSRLLVGVSTRLYRFVDGDPPSVAPDVPASPTWRDFLAGRDAALAAIIALLQAPGLR